MDARRQAGRAEGVFQVEQAVALNVVGLLEERVVAVVFGEERGHCLARVDEKGLDESAADRFEAAVVAAGRPAGLGGARRAARAGAGGFGQVCRVPGVEALREEVEDERGVAGDDGRGHGGTAHHGRLARLGARVACGVGRHDRVARGKNVGLDPAVAGGALGGERGDVVVALARRVAVASDVGTAEAVCAIFGRADGDAVLGDGGRAHRVVAVVAVVARRNEHEEVVVVDGVLVDANVVGRVAVVRGAPRVRVYLGASVFRVGEQVGREVTRRVEATAGVADVEECDLGLVRHPLALGGRPVVGRVGFRGVSDQVFFGLHGLGVVVHVRARRVGARVHLARDRASDVRAMAICLVLVVDVLDVLDDLALALFDHAGAVLWGPRDVAVHGIVEEARVLVDARVRTADHLGRAVHAEVPEGRRGVVGAALGDARREVVVRFELGFGRHKEHLWPRRELGEQGEPASVALLGHFRGALDQPRLSLAFLGTLGALGATLELGPLRRREGEGLEPSEAEMALGALDLLDRHACVRALDRIRLIDGGAHGARAVDRMGPRAAVRVVSRHL
mmetsp:Transcript_32342/g.84963  ORF Transcript_32342/g.84963 Transcript_32342/m.84963 type:complete len:565 (-) Transcript_32342:911-2605(-)